MMNGALEAQPIDNAHVLAVGNMPCTCKCQLGSGCVHPMFWPDIAVGSAGLQCHVSVWFAIRVVAAGAG